MSGSWKQRYYTLTPPRSGPPHTTHDAHSPVTPGEACWPLSWEESEHPVLGGGGGVVFPAGYGPQSLGFLSHKHLENPGKCTAPKNLDFKA